MCIDEQNNVRIKHQHNEGDKTTELCRYVRKTHFDDVTWIILFIYSTTLKQNCDSVDKLFRCNIVECKFKHR